MSRLKTRINNGDKTKVQIITYIKAKILSIYNIDSVSYHPSWFKKTSLVAVTKYPSSYDLKHANNVLNENAKMWLTLQFNSSLLFIPSGCAVMFRGPVHTYPGIVESGNFLLQI